MVLPMRVATQAGVVENCCLLRSVATARRSSPGSPPPRVPSQDICPFSCDVAAARGSGGHHEACSKSSRDDAVLWCMSKK